jgi:hypothetical protein
LIYYLILEQYDNINFRVPEIGITKHKREYCNSKRKI